MTLVIPEAARRVVASFFDAATIERAEALVHGERVHVVKPPPWPVVARIGGGEGFVVTVSYSGGGVKLGGDCSCPAGGDCEHVAATALLVFAQEREYALRRAEAVKQAAVGEWLAELGRSAARGGAGEGAAPAAVGEGVPTGERVVAYVLDAREGDLGVTVLSCTRLRSGVLGAGTVIAALGDPQRGAPAWVGVDDLRRIAMLRAVTRVPPGRVKLPLDRLPVELVRELAEAGQLFWEHPRGAPLVWGETRRETLIWRPVPGVPGGERLGLDGALVIAPALECLYIDPDRGRLGVLDLGVPAGVVSRLLTGPPVPAAMRATVARSLEPLLAPAGVAAPAGDLLRLRLTASLDDEDATRRHLVRFVAEARYGEERYPLAVWDAARPGDRDLVAEGRAQARLNELLAALPHGADATSSVHLLADARHTAEVIVPALRAEGWECVLAPGFPRDAPLGEGDVAWVERLKPLADSRDWFAFELGVVVAGRTVPLLPILLEALRRGELSLDAEGAALHVGAGINLRLPEGELVHVPAERLARWLRPLVELELGGLDVAGNLRLPATVAAALDQSAPGRFAAPAELAAARTRLAALLELAPRAEPEGFAGELRPYQRIGHAWLRFLHDSGYGGVLADEMGLGKTVQVLAFLDGLRAEGRLGPGAPALVVAPRSVVGNWAREAARFAPGLGAATVHLGADRAEDPAALARASLVLTSYQTLARDLPTLGAIAWTTVILDEAQALKNPDTQLRGAVATLRATSRFAVTGTPLENHLGELWSQVDLVMPGLLGRRRSFDAFFRRPVEKFGKAPPLEHLRARLRPFLLRRTKEVVEPDLPPRTDVLERIELDVPQRDLYESLRLELDAEVREALTQQGLRGASMVILDALLKLRQCCCDPRLVRRPEAARVQASAKLDRLMDMLVELVDSGRTSLVFSQFTSMLALIAQACDAAGVPYLTLTGETRDRDEVVRRFQAGAAPVLLVSLKAGGVGLNLTRADTVIHYDPWWNPAAEEQAVARAHRIGQAHPVMVYKLVARGTLEEAICTLQDEKRQLTAAALDGGGVTGLGEKDLEALYRAIV